ncbi:MAG: hypothetical protein H6624_02570 [Bdellovibrionaceae bacterium]|nr:hypothetical protein [Bdellovibrionales bacterium]MCB9083195.1 hypothetical protein [Pseudobdellovibrionaceae bacterium]
MIEKAWRINSDPQAMALAQLENNYQVAENYILPRSEDKGFEKVRILKLESKDARKIKRDLANSGQTKNLEQLVKSKIARGEMGIELAQGRVNYQGRQILVYRYQIQGHPLPLIVSAFGYRVGEEVVVATYMTQPTFFGRYRQRVDEFIRDQGQH